MSFSWIRSLAALAVLATCMFVAGAEIHAAQVYWVDAGTGKIQRAALDGTNVEDVVVGLEEPDFVAVDKERDLLFWTDRAPEPSGPEARLHRATLSGADQQDFSYGFVRFAGLTLDHRASHVYLAEGVGEGILRVNYDGTAPTGVGPVFSNPVALAIDPPNDAIFFEDGDDVRRMTFDGTEFPVVRGPLDDLRFLAVDPTAEKLYWSQDTTEDRILRMNYDGSNVEVIVTDDDNTQAGGIAVDSVNQKIYWTDPAEGVIRRANLDGTGAEVIVSGLTDPRGIVLDVAPVPEPASVALLTIGMASLWIRCALRRRKADANWTPPSCC